MFTNGLIDYIIIITRNAVFNRPTEIKAETSMPLRITSFGRNRFTVFSCKAIIVCSNK